MVNETARTQKAHPIRVCYTWRIQEWRCQLQEAMESSFLCHLSLLENNGTDIPMQFCEFKICDIGRTHSKLYAKHKNRITLFRERGLRSRCRSTLPISVSV